MKFEQLLQVYWSKGFLYGGKVKSFDTTLNDFFDDLPGSGLKAKSLFIKRFELDTFRDQRKSFTTLNLEYRKIINMYLSQVTSINNSVSELSRYNLIRLYLIKSRRGRAQALGKPSRGQRTWSNAWNAYRCNRTVRLFINEVKRNNVIKKVPEKINFKKLKRKVKKTPVKIKMQITKKKTNLWF